MATQLENLLSRGNACIEAKSWIQSSGITTFEQAWEQCPEPAWMLWALQQAGHEEGETRHARKWVHQCLLLVYEYLSDPRCQRALTILEAYAGGGSTQAEMQDALASATAAVATRTSADAFAKRASAHYHATRAVVAALTVPDQDWAKSVNEATACSARAAAQTATEIDHAALVAHRQKQADVLRSVFSADVAVLIGNLKELD